MRFSYSKVTRLVAIECTEHSTHVTLYPVFHIFVVFKTDNFDGFEADLVVGRRNPEEVAGVEAAEGFVGYNQVVFGNLP